MSEDPQCSGGLRGAGGLRERVLASLFEKIEPEDAVVLAGILFEYRIVLSKKFWSLLPQHSMTSPLEALEPQAASILVANLFGMDCDALFISFEGEWSKLRDSPRTNALKARIESHEFVDRLEPWTSLP